MRVTEEDFEAWNEAMATKYNPEDYYEGASSLVRFVERRRLARVIDAADAHAYDDVLEVGCGPGVVLEALHVARIGRAGSGRAGGAGGAGDGRGGAAAGTVPEHGRLVGVDLSERMLELALKRLQPLRSAGVEMELHRAAAEELPFEDGSFDVIVCTEVLEHVVDPAAVIRELARVARPAARIVMSVPNEPLINRLKRIVGAFGLFDRLLPGIPKKMDDEWHIHSFDLGMLKGEAKPFVTLADVRAVPWNWLPLRYVVLAHRRPGEKPECS